MKSGALVVVLAMAIGACASSPAPEAHGRRLIDQMKAAMGGKAWDAKSTFHKSGSAERGGQHVTYEVWGDLRAGRSAQCQTFDGKTFCGGFDGTVSWSQGPQGVRTSTSADAIANARFGSYATTMGWFFPDRFPATFIWRGKQSANNHDYDVVEVNALGAPFPVQLWLDPLTHVLKRTSASNGKESFYADTLRYEIVDGVSIDFRNDHYDDGKLEAQTLEHFEFTPVPAERFSPPK